MFAQAVHAGKDLVESSVAGKSTDGLKLRADLRPAIAGKAFLFERGPGVRQVRADLRHTCRGKIKQGHGSRKACARIDCRSGFQQSGTLRLFNGRVHTIEALGYRMTLIGPFVNGDHGPGVIAADIPADGELRLLRIPGPQRSPRNRRSA